jgi:arylsulfatase A-like enzyme
VHGREGGTRLVGAIRGPGIQPRPMEFGLMHGADWMPTLVSMAMGKPDGWRELLPKGEPAYELGDGMDVWPMLSKDGTPSPRTEAIIETHPDMKMLVHGHALIVWPMKIIKVG